LMDGGVSPGSVKMYYSSRCFAGKHCFVRPTVQCRFNVNYLSILEVMPLRNQNSGLRRCPSLQFKRDGGVIALRDDLLHFEPLRYAEKTFESLQILVRAAVRLEKTDENEIIAEIAAQSRKITIHRSSIEILQHFSNIVVPFGLAARS